jgi:3-oxoacyl-[acyl-carrier protein] reductase
MAVNGSSAKNKLALVFGGSRGIGAACVHSLAQSGFEVACTYVSGKPATPARSYRADVGEPEEVARAFADAARDFGSPVHCVVANAGIGAPPGPVAQFDPASFRRLVEVNIVGAFNVLREAGQHVADGGSIIAITTSMVRQAVPGFGPYAASKAAVECLVRSMSKEIAARKVRVNAVAPGPTDTDLFRAGKTDEAKQRSAALSPFNRIGTPAEVAEVVAFLASDKASWVHGQIVQPNGGWV